MDEKDLQVIEEKISSTDGVSLFSKFWINKNSKALICIVHGFGEHIGRYDHVANFFVDENYSVLGFDLRGHGKSEGLKGHAESLEILLEDIEEILKYGRMELNDVPIILFGHSMGGNLVLNYVLKKPVTEISYFIASSPWLGLAITPPRWKLVFGEMVVNLFPKIRQPNGLDSRDLSKIEQVAIDYSKDPLVNHKISAGLFKSVSDGAEFVSKNIVELKIDGLVYHGSDDRIISHDATEKIAIKSDRIIWKSWKGVYHEPHNDVEKKEILEFVAHKIEEKL